MQTIKRGYPDYYSDEDAYKLISHLSHEYSTKFHLNYLISNLVERGKAFSKIQRY